MSIVRYVNKKTGQVALYESTSHYDPETKQSRPIRKYLGIEDPETGELIPTAGKRGRKKGSKNKNTVEISVDKESNTEYKYLVESLKKENEEKDKKIKELKEKVELLEGYLKRLNQMSKTMIDALNQEK
ncbi:MAG: hypothetical protein K5931_03690 [Lachnospiraceae bacterium]|nr:hypothetical protein [Lachnospiraceae bacterium]